MSKPNEKKFHQVLDDTNTLSITTLNTWALPLPYGLSHKSSRYNDIINAINDNGSDIICLQEVFHKNLRKKINENTTHQYPYHSNMAGERKIYHLISMDRSGGLVTLSKHPILYQAFFPFPENKCHSIIESVGRKGFLITTIQLENSIINVINTHLYAGDDTIAENFRYQQYAYMDSTIQSHKEWLERPIFMAGDLNIQHPKISTSNNAEKSKLYTFLSQKHWFDFSNIKNEKNYTYDPTNNFYANKKEKCQILDYIMTKSFKNPPKIKAQYILYSKEQSISDHNGYAVLYNLIDEQKDNHINQFATLKK